MGIAGSGVLLQGRNPLDLNRGCQNLFAQRGDFLHAREQRGCDGELRLIAHESSLVMVKYESSYWSTRQRRTLADSMSSFWRTDPASAGEPFGLVQFYD